MLKKCILILFERKYETLIMIFFYHFSNLRDMTRNLKPILLLFQIILLTFYCYYTTKLFVGHLLKNISSTLRRTFKPIVFFKGFQYCLMYNYLKIFQVVLIIRKVPFLKIRCITINGIEISWNLNIKCIFFNIFCVFRIITDI